MLKNILNKKGGVPVKGILIAVVVIAVIAAAVILFSNGFGLGGSGGSGNNTSSSASQSVSEDSSQPIVEELEYLEVTVTDDEYLYQNNKIGLDELIEKLRTDAAGKNVKVTDSNASKRAYEKLIEALKENNISYIK